ncbi:MAG: MBL fold metallo-hydrolase [Pseudomonadota bacterium]
MNIKLFICLLSFVFASTAYGENFTEAKVKKAQEIIEQAIDAHGGQDALDAMQSITVEHETQGRAVNQSLRPTKPWDKNYTKGISAVDFDSKLFVTKNFGHSGGFEFDNATVINGEQSFNIDYRANTAQPMKEPDFDNSSGPFARVTPALLVKLLKERSHTALYLGDVEHKGKTNSVVSFSMAVGPSISLYFDTESGLLNHSERFLARAGLVEYEFLDYEMIDGVAFNKRFELHVNGDLDMQRENQKITLNDDFSELAVIEPSLIRTEPIGPDEMRLLELSKGVYHVGGSGTYGLFVDMGDHLVAIGGTGGAEERIKTLRISVGDKPIRYAVMTHHHADHIMAAKVFAKEGATILAAKDHKSVVKQATEGVDAKIKTVGSSKTLKSKQHKLMLIDIGPTAHSEHVLVAWLPKQGILFSADHFNVPRTGPIQPAVKSTRTFAKALKRLKLKPTTLVSAHSPMKGTMQDLQKALDAKVVSSRLASAKRYQF